MNPVVKHTMLTAALLILGSASAQDLKAYRALAADLDGAVTARPSSAASALARLDAADVSLDALKPSLRNRQLADGLSSALDGARASLARSPAELEAQVLLARGLMRKALYDQTMTLLASTPANSAAQLKLLGAEFGLDSAAVQALVTDGAASRLPLVAWRLQRAAAQKVSAALKAAQPTPAAANYLSLARGMAWFTAVQDAPAAGSLKVSQFGDALRQLTGNDTAALDQSLSTLRQGSEEFVRALATAPSAAAAAPTPASSGGTKTTTAAAAVPETPTTPATPTPRPAAAGGAGEVYTALGRALSAAGHGDPALAREQLTQAGSALAAAPITLRSAQGYDALASGLSGAQTRTALRPADIQALIAEMTALERRAAGQPTSALDSLSAGVASGFSGWLRVLIFALLAALSFLPLYLLNLAFGGRNAYWRAIAAGLALLLLPAFLEGVFGLLGAIGDLSGLGALRAASNLTLSQGAYGLPLWALFTALAIGLSAYGFRGLCQQFGLLGRRTAPQAEVAAAQSLDWDEDL